MLINSTVAAGLFCFSLFNCVVLEEPTAVVITDNQSLIVEMCQRPVAGCALINENTVVVREQFHLKKTLAVLHHEFLHLELGPEHSCEMLERDNSYRDYLGVPDRYTRTDCLKSKQYLS